MMMRRLQLVGVVGMMLLATGTLATRLKAFAVDGHVWGVKQIPYYINPQNKYVSDTSAVAAITSAASTWRGAANIDLVYSGYTNVSSLTNDRVNAVFFRDDSSGYIAETYWWWDGTGHLVDADIVFHENNKFYSANIGCNSDGYYIENTGAHEFGHVLGMAHSSVELASMWPHSTACETVRESLDPDDVAGLQSLYPGTSTATPTVTAPSAPSGLTAGAASASPTSSVAMSWVDNATNETGYAVERSADGTTFAQRAQLASGATSYVDTGLASGATYYYRVFAFNSAGSSAYSNVASGQTQASSSPAPAPAPATAPGTPANPSPGDGAAGVNGNITLGWTGSNAQSYDVYLNGALVAKVTSTSWRAGALSAGTTYSWMIVAKNGVGSTSGPTWKFSTKATGKK
jgi:hypothetical protein